MKKFLFLILILAVSLQIGCGGEKMSVNSDKAYRDALTIMKQSVDSESAPVRVIAMELVPQSLGQEGGVICKQGLSDPVSDVRFAAAMGVGKLKYEPAREKLIEMAGYKTDGAEPDARVFCAVAFALHMLGDDAYTSQIGEMLFDRRSNIRAAAVVAMGQMRDPSAVVPLKQALSDELDQALRLEITRSLAMCGDSRSLRLLEAYTKAQFVDERIIAVQSMIEMKAKMGETLFARLIEHDASPRVKVMAAAGLANLGNTQQNLLDYCKEAALQPQLVLQDALGDSRSPTRAEVSSLEEHAAVALGYFNTDDSVAVLDMLLENKSPIVRVKAAASILKLLEPPYDYAQAQKNLARSEENILTTPAKQVPPKARMQTSDAK